MHAALMSQSFIHVERPAPLVATNRTLGKEIELGTASGELDTASCRVEKLELDGVAGRYSAADDLRIEVGLELGAPARYEPGTRVS